MQIALLCIHDLTMILSQLSKINSEKYSYSSRYLSQSTIGQHVRHVLEFYLCLLNNSSKEYVNYDERKRDLEIETNIEYAISITQQIIGFLEKINTNKVLSLRGNFTLSNFQTTSCQTNLERELLYCLEHSVHHQALIKVSLLEQQVEVPENFGVAPSTLRFRSSNAKN